MRSSFLTFVFLILMASPAAAQLVGNDTAPGDSCAGKPAGATRVTADADANGADVTLICDGSTWNTVGVRVYDDSAACGASKDGTIRYISSGDPPWQYCDGSAWVPFEHAASGGGTGCDTTPTTYSTPGSSVYSAPSGCSSVKIEAYGAGGGGAGGNAGGGGGGSSRVEDNSSTILALGGGGGGGAPSFSGDDGGGGGGGYGVAVVSVTGGENLSVYVGGGGITSCSGTGGKGGDPSGGSGGSSGGYNGGSSTHGGGGGGGASGGKGGSSTNGGGGGGGHQGGSGANTSYGGAGGRADDGGSCGTSTNGGACNVTNGGGGGSIGDTALTGNAGSGGTGGTAANSGPGNGGDKTCGIDGGDGKVVITPIASSSGGLSGPVDCPNIGDLCADGTVFAGWNPVTQDQLFIPTTDQETTSAWKTSAGTDDIATDSTYDGRANTNQVANSTTFPAFKLCKDLTTGGHSDWYLPSQVELYYLWAVHDTIEAGGNITNFQNAVYWSSTEYYTGYAWYQFFTGGSQDITNKTTAYRVRCVRR